MNKPVQVTFRNMHPSGPLEAEARARAAKLETFYPRIVGCRVVVEVPHRHRSRDQHVQVRIELSLPGEDIVVSHEPTLHGALRDAEQDGHRKGDDVKAARKPPVVALHHALVALHEAFDTARRRLQDFAQRQRDDVKMHRVPDGASRAG